MPAGCVAVVDAMGVTDAGIFGDILCERIRVREVAGLVTDGVIRDLAGVSSAPTFPSGARDRGPLFRHRIDLRRLAGADRLRWSCIFPDDIIVGDDDGAVVIPAALLDEVVEAAVGAGEVRSLDHRRGPLRPAAARTLPPNAETKARYAAFCAAQDKHQLRE